MPLGAVTPRTFGRLHDVQIPESRTRELMQHAEALREVTDLQHAVSAGEARERESCGASAQVATVRAPTLPAACMQCLHVMSDSGPVSGVKYDWD